MRLERIVPGRRPPAGLAGAVLTRDLAIGGVRWSKGRRLSEADLVAVAGAPAGPAVTVLCPDPGDVHEDDAGLRLAAAVAGGDPGVTLRGPAQSRVDLVAAAAGVVAVRIAALERMNRLDPLEVFTVFDGQVVAPGALVASVKVGPHLVSEAVLAAGEAIARRGGPLVRVRPFRPVRIAVLVKEHVSGAARERFEASVRAKAAGLGATLTPITYLPDDVDAVTDALAAAIRGARQGGHGARIVLTAGGASTDPADPVLSRGASGSAGGSSVMGCQRTRARWSGWGASGAWPSSGCPAVVRSPRRRRRTCSSHASWPVSPRRPRPWPGWGTAGSSPGASGSGSPRMRRTSTHPTAERGRRPGRRLLARHLPPASCPPPAADSRRESIRPPGWRLAAAKLVRNADTQLWPRS